MPLHETLGKVLAPFEHRSGLARADDRDVSQLRIVLEIVVDALNQRVFRTYHNHPYSVSQHEDFDAFEVIGLDVDVLAHLSRAGVARSDVQFLTLVALIYFPGQRMFAPAAA